MVKNSTALSLQTPLTPGVDSAVSVVGLLVGMICGILILLWTVDQSFWNPLVTEAQQSLQWWVRIIWQSELLKVFF